LVRNKCFDGFDMSWTWSVIIRLMPLWHHGAFEIWAPKFFAYPYLAV